MNRHGVPLNERLLTLRHEAGHSQSRMALLLGTGQNRVSMWENGKHRPTVETLARYAEVLDMTMSELLEGVA